MRRVFRLLLRLLLFKQLRSEQHKATEHQHDDAGKEVDVVSQRLFVHLCVACSYYSKNGKDQTKDREHQPDWYFYI